MGVADRTLDSEKLSRVRVRVMEHQLDASKVPKLIVLSKGPLPGEIVQYTSLPLRASTPWGVGAVNDGQEVKVREVLPLLASF